MQKELRLDQGMQLAMQPSQEKAKALVERIKNAKPEIAKRRYTRLEYS
jgi:hypothetical protein